MVFNGYGLFARPSLRAAGKIMTPVPVRRPAPFFVGDHPAMDFLNSLATPSGVATEFLRDGADLVDWLERAGMIDAAVAAKFRRTGDVPALDAVAGRARDLREWLRASLAKHAGSEPGAGAKIADLAPLNAVLALDDSHGEIIAAPEGAAEDAGGHRHLARRGHLAVRRVGRWSAPAQLLLPIAWAIADLICREDLRLIRTCEGPACTLAFLDRTKAHARRWCSMAACGNRAKAASYRANRRRIDSPMKPS
jgi:predicted RNA-binding Zn ribbon-like protein